MMGNLYDFLYSHSVVLSRVLAVVVRPSVRLSQVGVLQKRLNVGSRKQHHAIALFPAAEKLGTIQTGSFLTEAPNAVGVG